MRNLRRFFQLFFIFSFFILFLMAIYPGKFPIPVDFFLRLDPLLWLSTIIASRSFIIHAIPAMILLLFTVFFGRFFCGWICPMGTTIDGFDNLIKARCVNKTFSRFKWVKLFILITVITTAVFSVQIAGYLDPIPLFTRTTVTFFYPLTALIFDNIIGFLISFEGLEDAVLEFIKPLQDEILPDIKAFRGSVLIALIFLVLITLGFVHRRFWCRNLCPLGALTGLFSRWRLYKRNVSYECTECGLCLSRCRMDAIGKDFKSTDHRECISCMDCKDVCPVNAIHFGFKGKRKSVPLDFSRRRFLAAGATGVISFGILKTAFSSSKEMGHMIRPPGAKEEPEFLDRCVRCGECIRVCSSKGGHGLQHAGLEIGLEGLWTPVLLPRVGYCEYNCNLCGQVCPTGAITHLSLEEKKEVKMGTAHFDKTRCIPWYYGEYCGVCEEVCPLPEKAIQLQEGDRFTIYGFRTMVKLPYVDEDLCIGCGKCVSDCPVEGNRGIFLTNMDEQRWIG